MLASSSSASSQVAPGQTIGVSVFIDPMIATLDLSRSQVSGAYLVGTLTGAFTLPLVGRWIDRYGVRLMTAAIAAGFGTVLFACRGLSAC